jgi:hypothetical protein
LHNKANVIDVTRTFDQISKYLENRPTIQDLENHLEDRVTKNDLQLFNDKKIGIEECKQLLHEKIDCYDFKKEIKNV